MKVKIKKLFKDAVLPKQAKQGDAGIDLTVHRIIKKSLFKIEYGFGVAMELPPNTYADLRPRSSIHKFWMLLSNSCGVKGTPEILMVLNHSFISGSVPSHS